MDEWTDPIREARREERRRYADLVARAKEAAADRADRRLVEGLKEGLSLSLWPNERVTYVSLADVTYPSNRVKLGHRVWGQATSRRAVIVVTDQRLLLAGESKGLGIGGGSSLQLQEIDEVERSRKSATLEILHVGKYLIRLEKFARRDGAEFAEALEEAVGNEARQRMEHERRIADMVAENERQMVEIEAERKALEARHASIRESASHAMAAVEADVDRPADRLIRSPHDAEIVAAEWMRWMGFDDAEATPVGPDAGIDIHSSSAIAQVKAHVLPVGRPDVQQLFGVATHSSKTGLFFSLSGYTADALAFGTEAKVALFTFDLQGRPEPVNEAATSLLLRRGEKEAEQ